MTNAEQIINLLADIDPAFIVKGLGRRSVTLNLDAADAQRLIELLERIKAEQRVSK